MWHEQHHLEGPRHLIKDPLREATPIVRQAHPAAVGTHSVGHWLWHTPAGELVAEAWMSAAGGWWLRVKAT